MSDSCVSNASRLADGSIGAKPLVFLRAKEVCERLGVKKTKLYALLGEGDFPRPAKLGKASVWPEHEVEAFMAQKMEARYRLVAAA